MRDERKRQARLARNRRRRKLKAKWIQYQRIYKAWAEGRRRRRVKL